MPRFNFYISYNGLIDGQKLDERPRLWFDRAKPFKNLDEAIAWSNHTFHIGTTVAIVGPEGHVYERFTVPRAEEQF